MAKGLKIKVALGSRPGGASQRVSHLIPLCSLSVTVETEQLPVAPSGGLLSWLWSLLMNRELAQLLAVKFCPHAHRSTEHLSACSR